MIRVDLARIVLSETEDRQIIVLKERDGQRSFPIAIGIREAHAIRNGVHSLRNERPLTHELMMNVFEALGVSIDRVVVNDLRDDTFYARLVIAWNGKTYDVDSRPSDAIALAVQRQTPIYVEDQVFDKACRFEI